MNIANEAYDRVNCYGIGRWLEAFARDLGATLPDAGLSPGARLVMPRASGTSLTLYRLPDPWPAAEDPRDRIVLERVEFTPPAAFPLGLDAATETPDSARTKLSSDLAGASAADLAAGDTRISFFMSAARVIEISFDSSLVGFGHVVLARLGIASDWIGARLATTERQTRADQASIPFIRLQPQGFGPIPPFWQWRERHLGTRDEAWARDRCPQMLVLAKVEGDVCGKVIELRFKPGLATMSGKIMFNDGASTRTVYEGRATLIDILVEDADTIWACGRNGTLLQGNSVSGFQQMPDIFDHPRFTSMTRFNGMLYLATEFRSRNGLFTYSAGTLPRVSTGFDPEVEDRPYRRYGLRRTLDNRHDGYYEVRRDEMGAHQFSMKRSCQMIAEAGGVAVSTRSRAS